MKHLITFLILYTSCVLSVSAENWHQWRGINRQGHSPSSGLLKKWPESGPERVWLFKDAGVGYSAPSIVNGKLFTMGARDSRCLLFCLNADTGEELWNAQMGKEYDNRWGNGPRGTPTVDGDFVYAMGGEGDLLCVEAANGKLVWKVNMQEDFGGELQNWGYTESVLVDGDQVIATPGGEKGSMVALNKKTGKLIWQSKDLTVNAQYSSPIVINHNNTRQYVQLFMKKLAGVDAKTGNLLWETDWPGRTAVIPTPIFKDGVVYITAGYGTGCKAVRLGPNHQVEEVYKNKVMTNHHGGVILVDDHLYGYSEGAGWVCQSFKTGEMVWNEKGRGKDAVRKGALGYADGMLYCLDEGRGTVALAKASPNGWEETGRFTLEPQSEIRKSSGRIWTHPVIVNGKLYLRDQDLIYCYDVKS